MIVVIACTFVMGLLLGYVIGLTRGYVIGCDDMQNRVSAPTDIIISRDAFDKFLGKIELLAIGDTPC